MASSCWAGSVTWARTAARAASTWTERGSAAIRRNRAIVCTPRIRQRRPCRTRTCWRAPLETRSYTDPRMTVLTTRLAVSIAGPQDDADLRRLMRETPVTGAVSVAFAREPSFFFAAGVEGDTDTVIAR